LRGLASQDLIPMVDIGTQLEICSFHPKFVKKHEKSTFQFYAFNLSTGQAIPVTMSNNVLSIHKHDVQFSQQTPLEPEVVRRLQSIIERPHYDKTDTKQSVLSANFRAGLQNLLLLYSSTITGQHQPKTPVSLQQYTKARAPQSSTSKEDLKMHEISFLELTFSIVGHVEYTNNFAAIVPISNKNNKLSALLPFNGGIWEEAYADASRCCIQSKIIPNTPNCDFRISQLRTLYGNREVMYAGIDLIAPFLCLHAGREDTKKADPNTFMIMQQNTETYVMMYGALVSIGRSQVLMTEHPMHMKIVRTILLATINIFGHTVRVVNDDLYNNFMTILCYCIQMGFIGHGCYREDIVAEDIRKRYKSPPTSAHHKLLHTLLATAARVYFFPCI